MCLKGNNVQKAMLNEKTNNKTKLVVYLARKVHILLENKKDGICYTYHELLSKKWVVKRSQSHAS